MGLFSFLTQDIARYRPEDRKGYRYWRKSPADAGKDT